MRREIRSLPRPHLRMFADRKGISLYFLASRPRTLSLSNVVLSSSLWVLPVERGHYAEFNFAPSDFFPISWSLLTRFEINANGARSLLLVRLSSPAAQSRPGASSINIYSESIISSVAWLWAGEFFERTIRNHNFIHDFLDVQALYEICWMFVGFKNISNNEISIRTNNLSFWNHSLSRSSFIDYFQLKLKKWLDTFGCWLNYDSNSFVVIWKIIAIAKSDLHKINFKKTFQLINHPKFRYIFADSKIHFISSTVT